MITNDEDLKALHGLNKSLRSAGLGSLDDFDAINRIIARLEAEAGCRQAMDEELSALQCGVEQFETPRQALQAIINWRVHVALDPAVSSQAQALVDKGRREDGRGLDPNTSWPSFRVAVDKDGNGTVIKTYAPGLPEGEHDVWCEPVAPATTEESSAHEPAQPTDREQRQIAALRRIDASWTSYWPGSPDASTDAARVAKISDETADIWRAIRAEIAAFDAAYPNWRAGG